MVLTSILHELVATGLRRKGIQNASDWAVMYRVMGPPFPGPWSYARHSWLKAMMESNAEEIVGQKAAQMGYTEVALNKTLFALDALNENVLYVLPSQHPDATDFSSSRLDPALEMSEHLSNLFTDRKNTGHKRAGIANLYIRGSRSRSQLKSIPTPKVMVDELDEMDQENVSLIPERMSGQPNKQIFYLSTPTIADYGINNRFKFSDQRHFFFRCPCCNRWEELVEDNLVITADEITDPKIRESYYVCKHCKGRLEHSRKIEWLDIDNVEWVPKYPDRPIEGYHIPQFYSHTVKPYEMAANVIKAKYDIAVEQELYNSKYGLPHETEGARVTEEDINKCIGTHTMLTVGEPNALVTLGADVGSQIHYVIERWYFDPHKMTSDINTASKARLLRCGTLQHFEQLDLLMKDFNVTFGVVDANPERRKATEFAQRFYGKVLLCLYSHSSKGRQLVIKSEEHLVTADRTSWMDLALGRVKIQRIALPRDVPREFREHLKAPVRVFRNDTRGEPLSVYVKGEHEHDHYAHARTYSEIAFPNAASLVSNKNIVDLL